MDKFIKNLEEVKQEPNQKKTQQKDDQQKGKVWTQSIILTPIKLLDYFDGLCQN